MEVGGVLSLSRTRHLAARAEVLADQVVAGHGVSASVGLEIRPEQVDVLRLKPVFAVERKEALLFREKPFLPHAFAERLRERETPFENVFPHGEIRGVIVRAGDELGEHRVDEGAAAAVVDRMPVPVRGAAGETPARVVLQGLRERVELGEREVGEATRRDGPASFGVFAIAGLQVREKVVEHPRRVGKEVLAGDELVYRGVRAGRVFEKGDEPELLRQAGRAVHVRAMAPQLRKGDLILVQLRGIRIRLDFGLPHREARLDPGVAKCALEPPDGVLARSAVMVVTQEVLTVAQGGETRVVPTPAAGGTKRVPLVQQGVGVGEASLGLGVKDRIREPRLRFGG